ncbi:beta-1,4-mannosyl-glycoprotein 4-beta-N-acetylglucosaminyltransferase [Diabrotica virgifera virgifera]|uniref:Beta-1,4-mannosyl-glycoprotein 4-beta-N-acetylglucosaminyltransferase n=1 Tax=Diabrotica virgifera virgifera TaxID=50390 RepID=A0ABM5J057_DIAVI|nr:beta-1,4-mannosyl-glycoprotein 4-beta-N-acetylglucosaminyltransferase [Diabrotica virgifera virgifera]
MYIFRFNLKRISVWILILCQLFLIIIYFYSQLRPNSKTPENGVRFLKSEDDLGDTQMTYHVLKSNIILKTVNTRQSYIDFNSSLCFKNGTDLESMKISQGVNWKCTCLPGWHGNDCGIPEVMWRAVIASKKPYKIKGPRTFERRLIYLFKVNKFSEYLADMRINDLGEVVDLFILYEDEESNFLQNKLDSNFCKEYQNKILYIQDDGENLWKKVKNYLKNIRNDDIILSSDINELPNKDALVFLKFHDHWPQPIKFRYRWSVFGFFWKHPGKTITGGGASTVSFLKESFNNKVKLLTDNKTLSSPAYKGLTLGDLNHFGGWYCEYCNDPAKIVEFLATKPKNVINWDKIDHQKVDNSYIEDLIENGVYIDGKTELTRAHKYQDNYFAPKFVLEHDWKYDFLLINFYSKADYYDI